MGRDSTGIMVRGDMLKNEDGTETEDIFSAPKGVWIPTKDDVVPPEEDTLEIGQCTDAEKGITVRPQGVLVRYAIPFSLWEPMGPPEGYVHDDKDPYIYPNYFVHTNEEHKLPDDSKKGWHTIESAKKWILEELPGIHADFWWDRPRLKYVPDRNKVETDQEDYWTDEELRNSPAHWLRVNNEGPFLRIFGPEVQAEGFISLRQDEVDQDDLMDMIKSLGYKAYSEFPLPLPHDEEMDKVEWADTSKWMGPDAKFQKEQDWSDLRGNCFLRHPDYFTLPEHEKYDALSDAQKWRMRSGLMRDPVRLPPKSEAQRFAEKMALRRSQNEAKKAAKAEAK